ncbi:alpha/beta fold hydrolase [Rubrobacter marinus]|uniref:Alpha/beta fold hydrolase n=2 Tax=Rubrobacter marinus TaxID=2653852 RepID=A0A6G8Q2S5_9ACTN|nr:alpha/beta fold hydrolase [Rubrobacter marinus]
MHYVRHGTGTPILLLHGWSEFWYVWRKNVAPLAEAFDVVVPDLRGFGETEKVPLPDPPSRLLDDLVEDLRGLADALGFEKIGLVSHDVGSSVAQQFARRYPERLTGLFFFNCTYPGIGRRWAEPESVAEIWYQSFHRQPWAQEIVGESRRTCGIYLKHFLDHWAHEPGLFDAALDLWVDNFMRPGNLRGGFDWYVSTGEARMKLMREGAPELPKIETPARFLWGESDPILKVRWADRLGEYFAEFELTPVPEAGHFVHYEKPELANAEIARFFGSL